jgi:hypothetical protein
MSDKLLKAIRKRESARIRPEPEEPEKPKRAPKRTDTPTEGGLGKVTTDDLPHA